MSNESKRALGSVVFENNTMMFMANALTNREVSKDTLDECVEFGNRNRWAYLAVGYKESEELRKNNPDSEELLKAIKTKYEPLLRESIKPQDGISKSQLQDKILNKDSKRIYLVESDVCATNSIKELLQVNNMYTKANKLEETHTKVGPRVTRMSLGFTRQGAQRLLDDDYVVAIVAVAYGYNGEDSSLKLSPLPKTMVAFTPRTRFECGVFFDGTNNNMYNTQMREAYEEYFRLKADMISGIKPKDYDGWESKILDPKVPESEILPLIFQDLKKYMEDKEIYGTKRQSQKEYNDGVMFGWGQNDVSKDCDAIYEYFRDSKIQEVLKDIAEMNAIPDDLKSKEDKKNETQKRESLIKQTAAHIEDEILISGEDSSYTGALSNVAKLYECYDVNVTKTTHKDADLFECFRDKIYVEGAGTHSDSKEKNDEADDWFLGQAFAIGDAGVKAKVNKACKKLHEKISNLGESYIDTLVLDVFGFSRGAAQARHFVSKLCEGLECTFERKLQDKKNNAYVEYELTKGGENLYPHILQEEASQKDSIVIDKIVFRFVGVFDTVPHEGFVQWNDEEDLNLKLEPKKVSRVVHLTARDEFRYNFDLVSIFEEYSKESTGEKVDENFLEKEFFGAHSDVGGGYKDNIAEEVELPTQIRRLHSSFDDENKYDKKIIDKIKKWNKKHCWIKDMDDSKIINVKNYEKIGTVDGFYIKKRVHKEREKRTLKYRIYMYRAKVDSEYSQVPLEYMHNKIKEILPMNDLKNLTYRNFEFEIDKAKVISADEEYYKQLKPQFVHHSSSLGVAHKPNRGSENGLYGKRTIHYV